MVYGQTEVTRDLMDARRRAALPTVYEAATSACTTSTAHSPRVALRRRTASSHELDCDFIAGCDGFHGVCRASVPRGAITDYEKVYPVRLAGRAVGHAAGRAKN